MRKLIRALLVKIAHATGIKKYRPQYGIYLPDIIKTFEEIDKQGICYVVLRWFDDLPIIKQNEDIDILVSDNDFKRIKRILRCRRSKKKDFIQFDIYPESNLTGNITSYFPPIIASRILKNKRKLDCGIWVPNNVNYFYSLSYHALFHKGFSSGIPSRLKEDIVKNQKHDFVSYLTTLAKSINIDIDYLTMELLEQILRECDWLPPLDVYFRRSKNNEWARLRAKELIESSWVRNYGAVVFILREKIVDTTVEWALEKMLLKAGAKILQKNYLTKEEAIVLSRMTRGGDWGNPSNVNYGGLPILVILAKNLEDHKSQTENIPLGVVEYKWVMEIKRDIRKLANKGITYKKQHHVLHTSDNGIEAAYYMSIVNEIIAGRKNKK